MISKEEILRLHALSIEKFGGANGIRDINLLESAVARPFLGFGEDLFYKTTFEQAAALAESIIKNHPFIDGNKRTGFLAAAVSY
ncbi:type II toxin-antitoxin system death-on-curing family toxin [Parafilimonas sp.]|uniref:type II toxin-antitoxin system death-on-curing family toxin n=1 Tax=Parafilimonas sp. TaxID=1969739 RepID=UPI0039E52A3F